MKRVEFCDRWQKGYKIVIRSQRILQGAWCVARFDKKSLLLKEAVQVVCLTMPCPQRAGLSKLERAQTRN